MCSERYAGHQAMRADQWLCSPGLTNDGPVTGRGRCPRAAPTIQPGATAHATRNEKLAGPDRRVSSVCLVSLPDQAPSAGFEPVTSASAALRSIP